ncbi:MAG TPA: head GIN domain-containing protein [Solirubrobacteraceae bacterium]
MCGGRHRAPIAFGALLLTVILMALVVDRIFFHGASSPAGAGSGVAATQLRSLPRFTGVALAGANNVVVEVGGRQSVVVHADRNLLRRVTTRVRSGRLVIGTTPGKLEAKSPMFVTVAVPALDAVSLEGAGNIAVTGIHSRTLRVALPGSGNIDVTGTTTKRDVTIDGAGTTMLRGLIARDAKAAIDGDGSVSLTATRSLTARVSGSGTVTYGGNPLHVTQTVAGSGTISAG